MILAVKYVPAMYATVWALVPPVVAIVLALITKEVYSSLFVGIVIGGLFYAVAVNKGRLEDLQTKQLAVMIVLSLYMGLTSSGVDNAAHVAGLILGILLGILLYRKPKKKMDDGGVWNER